MKDYRSWVFSFLWWLTFVVIVFVVLVLANRQWILKDLAERQIRAATGLEPEIGDFSFGMINPKMTLGDLKLYNPADFGGTLFLDVPELHVEYDQTALRRHEIHITLMRVNLREVDVVKNEAGATNLISFINRMAPRNSGGGGRTVAPLNGYQFKGIDVLNLSIGKVKFVDLKDPLRNRAVAINIENQIYTNVLSPANLPGLSGQLWLRGGNLVGLPVHPPVREAKPQPDTKLPAPPVVDAPKT